MSRKAFAGGSPRPQLQHVACAGSGRRGEAKVAVSAGNTGALMAISMFRIGLIEGISRPAIAVIWPTMRGQSVVLDVGANAGSDAEQLVDFAVMGEAFARAIFGIERPTVGLLNIGEEEVKGIESVKRAAQILRASRLPIEFYGNIEGDGIGKGVVDVVVTDGFTGNVALKTAEGTAELIIHYLRIALKRSLLGRLGAILASGAFRVLKRKLDPRTLNGGVFLGLNGVVVKSHGSADALGLRQRHRSCHRHGSIRHDRAYSCRPGGCFLAPRSFRTPPEHPTGAGAAQAAVS